jgi:hypothetical protein
MLVRALRRARHPSHSPTESVLPTHLTDSCALVLVRACVGAR